MANNCFFTMHVKGKKENVDEFFAELRDYERVPHFWRVFSADRLDLQTEPDGTVVAEIIGDCAWSVYCCMCDGAGTYAKDCPQVSTSLQKESKRLSLAIEIFSEEPGAEFQEHYHYEHGERIAAEDVKWHSFWFDEDAYDAPTREEKFAAFLTANDLRPADYSLDDLDDCDCVHSGGFGNYGDFAF